ncbi:MAG TPA: matrixin family metalloprotease [Baekduia sp.]|uniref:matrixin family metalloprotease n=1 Tax=Baekduia sp. TaxID=2600305 RepID=UPI002B6D6081|nr:matrixin family metalloprotease [Baekduia sp.]HMJ35447.1 matrixin family metalloprotease [Baekduia sp.]
MDGSPLSSPRRAARLLVAAGLALLAVAGGAGTALAEDGPLVAPATRWPAGGAALRTATGLATERWGFAPCGGRVTLTWGALSAGINAEASWTNDVDPYLQPSRNGDCAVTLASGVDWDWPKLCSVVVHELGHLAGHDHVEDPDDIMFFTYMRPIPECVSAPEPVAAAAPAARSVAIKASAKPKVKATTKAKAKAKAKPKARTHPRARR